MNYQNCCEDLETIYNNYCEKIVPNCQVICVGINNEIIIDSHLYVLKMYSAIINNMSSDIVVDGNDVDRAITILYSDEKTLFYTIMFFYSIETTGTLKCCNIDQVLNILKCLDYLEATESCMNICLNIIKESTEDNDTHTLIQILWIIFDRLNRNLWVDLIIQKLCSEPIGINSLIENNKISVKHDISKIALEILADLIIYEIPKKIQMVSFIVVNGEKIVNIYEIGENNKQIFVPDTSIHNKDA